MSTGVIYLKSSNDQQAIRPLVASSATIYQAINGEYSCDVYVPDYGVGDIEAGMIVELTDADGTVQKFRIQKPVETLDAWLLQGRHITHDLEEDMILDRGWIDSTGTVVWPQLVKAGISERRFAGTSDIATVNSVKLVRKSVWEAMVGGADNTFLSRWGGELQRNNYTINAVKRLGTDGKYYVTYRHNLTGIEITEDESQIVNRIIPTALISETGVLSLPESYIDAANIAETAIPHVRHVHYSDIRVGVEEDGVIPYPTVESAYVEMRKRVTDLYQSGVSQPALSVRIEFVDLAKTEEYKDYAPMLELSLGDGVTAEYKGRSIHQRIVAYTWDVLRQEYESLTLGSIRPSVQARLAQINTELLNEAELRSYQNVYSPLVGRINTLNESAARAVGMYTTEGTLPTGGKVIYYHDQPTLAESMLIEYYPEPGSRYWTQSGWNNGSPVWMYGNDKSGMLVMRLIAAEGIEAQWIRVSSGTTLSDKLTETDALQSELAAAVQGGGRNLVLGSDEVLDFVGVAKWSDLTGQRWNEV